MRVVIVGATGNVGTSLVKALASEAAVDEIVGIARRVPTDLPLPRVEWVKADITVDRLAPIFSGADAVVHLAWAIQPSRDEATLHAINVVGSERVFADTAEAGVSSLVYASSIGAYSPGPKDSFVDESWPTEGIESAFYSRHKAQTERLLDAFEVDNPAVRVARLRPGLIFKRESASEQRRLFAGPFVPRAILRHRLVPFVPDMERLRLQALHADDVADAYRRVILSTEARGAFNVAAADVLDPPTIAGVLNARTMRISPRVLRFAVQASWTARLQPTPAGWLDMGLAVPLMDTSRIRNELGWHETMTAADALAEVVEGIGAGAGGQTPALAADAGGKFRQREIGTGIGARQ